LFYFARIEGGSWNGGDSLFYNYVFCHWRRIAATVVAIVAIVAIGVVIFQGYSIWRRRLVWKRRWLER